MYVGFFTITACKVKCQMQSYNIIETSSNANVSYMWV